MKRRFPAMVLWLLGSGSLLVIAGILVYAWKNSSRHTGFDPYVAFLLFGGSSLAGLASGLRGDRTFPMFFALIAGLIGMGMVVALDLSNRLLYYERWIERGMP